MNISAKCEPKIEVIISLNNTKLEHFLSFNIQPFSHIYFPERDKELLSLLKSRSIQEIELERIDDDQKNELAEGYVELVGGLGKKYNSVYWWANFLSSKNKFVSRLFPNLFLFYSLINTLKNNKGKNIFIINPPVEILSSLILYCRANDFSARVFPYRKNNFIHRFKNLPKIVLYPLLFLYSHWKTIYLSKKYLKDKFNALFQPDGKYYVLRSWFYPGSMDDNHKYTDSFFGHLPHYLSGQGIRLMIVAGVQGDYEVIAKKIAGERDFFIVTQEYFLRYSDPLKAVFACLLHRVKIKDRIYFEELDVTYIVKDEIRNMNRYSLMIEYLYSYFVRRLLSYVRVATFVTTYENNPWEKVCFWSLRKYSPDTKIIGYQHAVLSQAHVNMLLSKEEKDVVPMPDKVITIGKVTRDILVNRGNYDSDRVKEGCGLRFAHIFKLKEKERLRNFTILVAPEGVLHESVNMFDFVYRSLANCKQYKIRLRPHPALPFPSISEHLSFDIKSTPNVHVSQNARSEKDLEEIDIVVYRGSSLCLEALKMGIPVIYISLKTDILSVDPLFECSNLKWSVRDEQELRSAVEAVYSMSGEEYKSELLKARNYLDSYVHEITEERLKEFII